MTASDDFAASTAPVGSSRSFTEVDLRELLVRTLHLAQGHDSRWLEYSADAIISALADSGLVVVPTIPTIPMSRVIVKHMSPNAAKYWPMVLSVSPYVKKENNQ